MSNLVAFTLKPGRELLSYRAWPASPAPYELRAAVPKEDAQMCSCSAPPGISYRRAVPY